MRTKIFVYYLLQFALSILFFGFVLLATIKLTFLNPSYITRQFEQKNYYQLLYEDMNATISNYIVQSGLPEKVLDDIYTVKSMKKDINNNIYRLYHGKTMKVDSNLVKKNLNTNIKKYLEHENIEITDQDSLNRFTKQIADEYESKITLNGYINYLGKIIYKINTGIILALIIITALILFLVKINKSYLKTNITIIPLFTSSILLFISYYFIKDNIDINNLVVWNKSLSKIIRYLIWKFLNTIKITSIIIFVFSIILSILTSLNIKFKDYFSTIKKQLKKLKKYSIEFYNKKLKKVKLKIIISTTVLVVWIIIIFLFSNQNKAESNSISDKVASNVIDTVTVVTNQKITKEKRLSLIDSTRFFVRKTAHFTLYFVLGILTYLAFSSYKIPKTYLCAVAFCLIYACSDEIHQLFTDGRSAKILDVFIDTMGASVSILITKFIANKNKYLKIFN